MTENYFSIERNGGICLEHGCFKNADGTIAFENVMNMSYDEMKSYEDIEAFILFAMDATNNYLNDDNNEQTIITLIGKDDVFIWSIIIGPGDNDDELKYVFVDWKKDGKSYRYKKD